MLEQDCYILLGALGGLGTGDLFLLICPAQSQAAAFLPLSMSEVLSSRTIVLIITCRRYRPTHHHGGGSFLFSSTWTHADGRGGLTSWHPGGVVFVTPRPSQGRSQPPLMPSPRSVIHFPPTHPPPLCNVCCSNLAGNAWVECQMLFLLGIYEKLSDSHQWCHALAFKEGGKCHMPLLHISVSSDNLLNYLRCRDPVMLSLV